MQSREFNNAYMNLRSVKQCHEVILPYRAQTILLSVE